MARDPASDLEFSPDLKHERGAGAPKRRVAGVDEVGRGCIAGPVVAGAAMVPAEWLGLEWEALLARHPEIAEITDSKKLTPKKRAELAAWIAPRVPHAVAACSVEEIDRWNILQASHRAMERALADLSAKARAGGRTPGPEGISTAGSGSKRSGGQAAAGGIEGVLVDGNLIPKGFRDHPELKRVRSLVKGDSRSLSIACASILAKVHRDEWMARLASAHPNYGFEVHKGYLTPMHVRALKEYGPCALHRRSFSPVKEMLGFSEPLPAEADLFSLAADADAATPETAE